MSEEQFCEIILNFDQWSRRRFCLKDDLSGALSALLLGGAEPLCTFEEGIMGNIHVKLYERTSDSLNEGLPIKMTREKFQRK